MDDYTCYTGCTNVRKGKRKQELFAAEPPPDADREYSEIRNLHREPLIEFRAYCERLWDSYWTYADEDFVPDFARRFHQRWFEMYLTVALINAGLRVSCPKPGPDVLIETGMQRVWIEAIAPTGGIDTNPDKVRYPVYEGKPTANWVPGPSVVLRIIQAFCEKSAKFAQYADRGIVAPDDACVIAINIRRIPYADMDIERYFKSALYAVGDSFVAIDRETCEVIDIGTEHRPNVARQSGAPVDADVFLTQEHAHISAVLGSRSDVANGPYGGDDFVLFPNPNRRVSLPEGLIPLGYEHQVVEQKEGSQRYRLERISHLRTR